MGIDASQQLGSEQIVGTRVTRRGFSMGVGKSASSGGGVVGALVSTGIQTVAAKKQDQQRATAVDSTAPDFGKVAWLALTAGELALLKLDLAKGGFGQKISDVIARVPRSQVTGAAFEKSAMYGSGMTIHFADGSAWVLEAPRNHRKDAQKMIDGLTGQSVRT